MIPTRFPRLRIQILSLLLTFFTGFTALVFQNTWHRYLNYLLGSQSEATALILATFLGGMAVGYYLYGQLTRVFHDRLFRLYGVTEFLIGLWALFSPQLFNWVTEIPIRGFASQFASVLLFLGPPTVLMGGTIPVLTQALSQSVESATRIHSRIYALNTFGASIGSLAAGFYLLPAFGLPVSLALMGSINILVGLTFYLLLGSWKTAPPDISAPASASANLGSIRWLWVIAFISGFVTIGLETIMIRVAGLSWGSSVYTFSLIVAIFIFCIAFGGGLVGLFPSLPALSITALLFASGFSLLCLNSLIDFFPYATNFIRAWFSTSLHAFPVYNASIVLFFGLILLIPISLCGAILPLCFHYVKRIQNTLGSEAGTLYAVNTAGCVLGALIPGYFLLFYFNLNRIYMILVYLMMLAAIVALYKTWPVSNIKIRIRLSALLVIFWMLTLFQPLWDNHYFSQGLFRDEKRVAQSWKEYKARAQTQNIPFYRDGPFASVGVVKYPETKDPASQTLYVNGKAEGNSYGDFYTMNLISHIPILFSKNPRKVVVIGMGTGMTAGAAAQYPEVENLEIVEISPMVIEAANLFRKDNYDVLNDPKTTVWNTDAFRFFRQSDALCDLIISEPSNPWMMGAENLFAREYFKLVYGKLAEHGFYIQWIQAYEISNPTFRLILNTFQSVFPYVYLFNINTWDYALLGSKEPITLDHLQRMASRLEHKAINRGLTDLGFDSTEHFLHLNRFSQNYLRAFAMGGGWHTLENPKLSYWAGKNLFQKTRLLLPSIPDNRAEEQGDLTLLKLWERHRGRKLKIQYPERFCRTNVQFCRTITAQNQSLRNR